MLKTELSENRKKKYELCYRAALLVAPADQRRFSGDDPGTLPQRRQSASGARGPAQRGGRERRHGEREQAAAGSAHVPGGTHRTRPRHRDDHQVHVHGDGDDAHHRQSVGGAPNQ